MTEAVEKKKSKRPSKGMRIHNRKIKQDGRKEGLTEIEIKKKLRQTN
jgi:hypothetical protein